MSVHVQNSVMARQVGSYHEKTILLRMAWAAHDNGTNCYVAKETMIAELEIPRSTFYEAIKELERKGLIVRAGKVGVRVKYTLNLGAIAQLPFVSSRALRMGATETDTDPEIPKQAATPADSTVQPPDGYRPVAGRAKSSGRTQQTEKKRNDTTGNEDKKERKIRYYANKINEGKHVATSVLTTHEAALMLHLRLVTEEQLRQKGIAF